MYKKISLLVILLFCFTLIGCVDTKTETPEDEFEDIDLTQLSYYRYLSEENPVITIKVKDYGVMRLQLFPEVALNTVNNYLSYVTEEVYTSNGFHRIIEGFMIQGGSLSNPNLPINGDFLSNGFDNRLSHDRGVISMARTTVNNSATSQFFIVHKRSSFLDGNYAGFGGLISGFSVLDQIAQVSTRNDVPVNKVIIESISVDLKGHVIEEVIYVE